MDTEQLNQQRLQQQIAEGDLGMQDRQRMDQLRATIADPSASEADRNAARQAYGALTSSPEERIAIMQNASIQQQRQARIMADLSKAYSAAQPTGENNEPIPFEQWAQQVLPTEQPATGAQVMAPNARQVEALRRDPERAKEFDQKFGAGASQRYLDKATG